jgi:hypothetical protein
MAATATHDLTLTRETFDAWLKTLPKAKRNVASRGARALLNFWSKLHEDGLDPTSVALVARYGADQAQNALDVAQRAEAA